MRILSEAAALAQTDTPVAAAIGVFDGVHIGHQAVLAHARAEAAALGGLSLAVTFDRHPSATVAPDRVPPLIQSRDQRMRCLERAGMDACWEIRFDKPFSTLSAESFIEILARDFGRLDRLCIGERFTFGHKRAGNLELLRSLGQRLGFTAIGLPTTLLDGAPVSSTRIRDAIREGRLHLASACLGRPFTIRGTVVNGRQLARSLGFPTANLRTEGLAMPPAGVYAAWTTLSDDPTPHPSVMNLGRRPTVESAAAELLAEVHIPGWNGDLYGVDLEVQPVRHLREERRFPSIPELAQQIERDIQQALLELRKPGT